jgi:predicted DCC family thiol-disulfide oxidoreductase YuxK
MAQKTSLVFYDATCVLCDRSILWLIKNDAESGLRFSHVASKIAEKQVFPVSTEAISVLTPEGQYLKSSQAALYLLLKTKRYPLLYKFLLLFPLSWLDVFYAIIAKNRYRWFGNYSDCKIPDRTIKSRFLDF